MRARPSPRNPMSPSRQNKDRGRGPGNIERGKTNKNRPLSHGSRPLRLITPALLRRWPLPQPGGGGDKEERGRVLIVGGASEMPGPVILSATAALRAGAGKLQIATCRSIAQVVAAAVPEARVFALPETRAGAIAASAATEVVARAAEVGAVLIGPGMIDEKAVERLMKAALPSMGRVAVVLDAAALTCFRDSPQFLSKLDCRAALTPHAGEMAKLLGLSKEAITSEPLETARRAAIELRATVALKGAETYIAAFGSSNLYCNRAGNVGLATSGSGDVLSGIIAGLAARGAQTLQAAVWGVYLHARAGEVLARRMGRLGYLARELPAEVPALMSELGGRKRG
jgi:ADP-dependent NAD(P)H-hydrate dehydratase